MNVSHLHTQWLSLCSALHLDGESQWQSLHTAYTTSGLAYHNLTHIADCLSQFSARKHEATDPIAVELAIWFHDVIYDPRASDNEEQSAQLASNFLTNTHYQEPVHQLILTTQHSDELSNQDEKLLCDIDLSILGSPPTAYEKYAAAIRDEYSWVPELDYQKGRTQVLENFLDRPSIFSLEPSRTVYEGQARQNLLTEIKTLSSPAQLVELPRKGESRSCYFGL